ncbi:MAG: DUF1232 domain-containing protein [Bacillota bacterium]
MRCPRCQEEVAFARVCPYCGQQMPLEPVVHDKPRSDSGGHRHQSEPKGRFRGVIEGTGPRNASRVDIFSNWLLLPRYLLDRSVPITRKLLLLLGVLYIIIPFDITPDFLPVLGWLDDIGVGIFLWNYLRNELANYRQRL